MEKISDVRAFRGVRMNLDAAPEALAPNETREIYNMIEENSSGYLVNMKGFENVMALPVNTGFSMPTGAFKCVGTLRDIENDCIVYALCDTDGKGNHCLLRMHTWNKALEFLLRAESLLNFHSDHQVSMSILGDLLYFTDGFEAIPFVNYNPPRKINMVRAAAYTNPFISTKTYYKGQIVGYSIKPGEWQKAYKCTSATPSTGNIPFDGSTKWIVAENIIYTTITNAILDRVKHPPIEAPRASFDTDSDVEINNLRNNLFQFAYRYGYLDNEKTVFSPYSIIPLPSMPDYINGDYTDDLVDNVIHVWMDTGPHEVLFLELIVRERNDGVWNLIKRIKKFTIEGEKIYDDSIYILYKFYNNEVRSPIDQFDQARMSDAVPQISSEQKLIEKNRIVDGDYTEGYDNVEIDVSLAPLKLNVSNTIQTKSYFEFTQVSEWWNIPDSVLAPMYEKGIDFDYGYALGNPPPAGSYISPQRYPCVVLDFSKIPLISGYEYTLNIQINEQYRNALDPAIMPYPDENLNDNISATATILGGPIKRMLNMICDIMRSNTPDTGNSVICFVNESYMGWNNEVWGLWRYQDFITPDPYNHLLSDFELGIIATPAGQGSVNWTKVIKIDLQINHEPFKIPSFKAGAVHLFGLVYFDRALRNGGVNKADELFIPHFTDGLDHGLQRHVVKWEINHTPPLWADSYQWVYAKQNKSMSYWFHCPISSIVNADQVDGYVGSYIALEIASNFTETESNILKFNVAAYVWERGDRIRFIFKKISDYNGQANYVAFKESLDFEILGVSYPSLLENPAAYLKDETGEYTKDEHGNKIKDEAFKRIIIKDFNPSSHGIISTELEEHSVIVEIYRPRLESDNTIYYEFNEIYDIIDPHTVNRRHSGPLDAGNNTPPGAYVVGWARDQASGLSARGIFYCGDCYIMPRYMINVNFGTVFPVENMSYSDFYNSMANNCGRPHAVNYDAKRQRFFSKLIYSGKYIQNTRINDLSKVNSSDSFDLAEKYGPIYKLEEVGDTLRILQRSKPSTLLIGRAGVTQAGEEGMQIISSTKDVLGTLYVQKSDFGTVHPSSYVKKETRGFFFDFYAQAICRDAGNGIQNISEAYGLNDFIREKCLEFEAPENVDVISAYDQQNELVWFTFINKRTEINRLIGGSSFTVAFRDTLGQKDDGFVLFSHSIPDYYGTAKRTLTSFKDGVLWYHNSETAARCNFYGTQYKYWASLVFNKLPLTIKRWLSIFVGSDKVMAAPDAGDISIPATGNNPSGIVSLLKAGAFETVQGKWVAEFGKNMTTNQAAASIEDLVNGDDLEGQTIGVTLEGDETEEHKLLSVEVQGVTSKI